MSNSQLIERFYSAFQSLDWKEMGNHYHDDAIFSDPVFENLSGEEVRVMWKMLCTSARDFSLRYGNIIIDGEYCTVDWTAKYKFSKTGRTVVNNVKAYIRIQDGLITEHRDEFDLYRWARQAMGVSGMLFGWTSVMKNGIRKSAQQSLHRFIEKEKSK
jgi:ketosteroid isomerase-like protein